MNGIIYGLIAMVSFGLGNAFTKKPLEEISPIKLAFYRNIFTSIILFLGIFFFDFQIIFDWKYVFFAIGLGVLGYIPLVLFYKAVQKGKIGIVSPIANTYFIFTVLLSVIFFGEKLSIIKILAILILIIGVFLSSVNFKDRKNSEIFKLSSGIPFALLTCVGRGFFFFLSKYPINVIGPILTGFIVEFMIMISAFLNLRKNNEKISLPNKKNLIYPFLVGLFGAIGVLTFNIGITKYDISTIATIVGASPIIPILFGKFVYKENLKLIQYFAVGIILVGLVLIGL